MGYLDFDLRSSDVSQVFRPDARAVVYPGSCLELLKQIPDKSIQLIITSPPYNIGKEYEQRLRLDLYIQQQAEVIKECERVLTDEGSICWQVGNYVADGAIIPLDSALYSVFANLNLVMRNRVVWHFEHGLHCTRRFSGRYETICWYTRNTKGYKFNVDPVRVPQKYPGKKHFKGPKAGQYSGNPLGKNPGDVWDIPNVKSNHIEKTTHPCQFPVELVERFILSTTSEDDWVLDPFLGVGTTIAAAVRNNRRGAGAEIQSKYVDIARERIQSSINGTLKVRPMGQPKYDPKEAGNKLTASPWNDMDITPQQLRLLQKTRDYKT